MSLPNTEGYRELTPRELFDLSDETPLNSEWPKTTKAMHNSWPAILLDHKDGRKEFYTMETAQLAKQI